jgi:hypothetical protein
VFTAEVKEWVELYLHSVNTPSWRSAQLKHKDNFNLTFLCEVQNWREGICSFSHRLINFEGQGE